MKYPKDDEWGDWMHEQRKAKELDRRLDEQVRSLPAFPVFRTHEAAVCFTCNLELAGEPLVEELPPGRGRYSKRCPGCHLLTWYDLRDELAPRRTA